MVNRRDALKLTLTGGFLAPLLGALPALARTRATEPGCSGELSCYNIHTDEELTVGYLDAEGRFRKSGLRKLNHLFRCHYTGKVHPIDPRLYVLLDAVRCRLGAGERPFELISGYRSPEYNALLRSRSHGVARNSYHLKGMAADVRLEGVSMADLREAALHFEAGGVGRYRDFIHIDVGPVRTW